MSALVAEGTVVDLDQVLWEMWKSMDVPEGVHVEIIEGFEVSPTGNSRHARVNRRLLGALFGHLRGSGWSPGNDCNVIHGLKVFIPDAYVAPEDDEEIEHPDGLGLLASGIPLVIETVSPGAEARKRDHVLKHRAYAAAGIPVYVIIDDYDDGGAVTILTGPDRERRAYASSTRVPYGKEAVIPEGPAEGFVIGPDITGERRD
ncbi:Uma2 family endonuclease [Kitasatospora sp. NPDC057542]|uniref:Uma2 family endonuclease n=1 Tax=Streptomycetaceae TaxID=2062 RepID=UPI001CCDED35|nr:Uma2 family endonuclease [Streptomyces sp. LS1784]